MLPSPLLRAQVTETLVDLTGATWRYNDTGAVLPASWRANNFSAENSWPSGTGLFGVEGDVPYPYPAAIRTPLALVPGRITYYFRTRFNFSGSKDEVSLMFSNYVDDGAVFYLNGTEVYRLRMPAAPAAILNSTSATGTPCTGTAQVGDAATFCPDVFTISGNLLSGLVQGENVIAVEVHNATGNDLVFGTALIQLSTVQTAPQLNIWTEGDFTSLFWNGSGFILQQSSDLGSPANWFDFPGASASPVTITNTTSTYFRLRN